MSDEGLWLFTGPRINFLPNQCSMSTADYPKYDFLAASKLERPFSAALKAWFTKFHGLFRERWCDFALSEIQVSPLQTDSLSFDLARGKWTRPTIACPLTISGLDRKSEVQGLLVAQCSDVVILMMEILSESLSSRPVDRELTSIEMAMCQLLFQTAASALSEAWLDKDMLPISLGEPDFQPNNSRLFAPSKEVIIQGIEIRTSSVAEAGPARFDWVLAKEELMNLLGVRKTSPAPGSAQKVDPELVSQIEIDVTAHLGSTELSMESLMRLAPGAIIRLDQRVDEPLVVMVNGKPKLAGWPGESNHKPCLLIESLL
jgi:flagellar motor switch protein FliM